MKMLKIIMLIILIGMGFNYAQGYKKFHGMHGMAKLNYDSLFAEAIPVSETAEGQALIENCLDRYHGLEKLRGLNSFEITYKMLQFMDKDSMDITKKFETGRKYKILRRSPVSYEERMLDGQHAWFQNEDTVIFLDSGRYKAELFSYLTLSMPLGMKTERFDDIRYGHRSNDSLDYIYMTKNDTLMIIVGIDPDDYLIKSSEGIIRQGPDNFVFINYFADHREFDGHLFPGTLKNVSMGLEVAHSTVINVEINPEFDDSDFMPKKFHDINDTY